MPCIPPFFVYSEFNELQFFYLFISHQKQYFGHKKLEFLANLLG